MSITRRRRDLVMRLILQIARDAVTQTHFKTLLTAANATITRHRQELRMAKAELSTRSIESRAQSAAVR
jgi:hypothetical protein